MMYFRRVCLAASTLLWFTIDPAAAQYNVFNSPGGPLTDVIINGRPETLASVRQFEERCQTRAAAGRWWLDLQNGDSGPEGGPATYNVSTCQPLTGQNGSHGVAQQRAPQTEAKCYFFSGGSFCKGPGLDTVNDNGR
jgi:hypothetical protein